MSYEFAGLAAEMGASVLVVDKKILKVSGEVTVISS